MPSLPADLDRSCLQTFMDCKQFDSSRALRAVFTTTELEPFADGLPERAGGDKREFVAVVKLYLLDTRLADGRVLLLPFLATLRDQQRPEDALHGELDDLYRRVREHLHPAPPATPLPIALNHYFICYAPRDGLHHAERLHDALGAAGLRPWLEGRDTPAG